jgi:hypothetical protein
MKPPSRLFTRLGQGSQEQDPVALAGKDGLAAVSPVHDVINRPFILDAQFSGHEAPLSEQYCHYLGLTPLAKVVQRRRQIRLEGIGILPHQRAIKLDGFLRRNQRLCPATSIRKAPAKVVREPRDFGFEFIAPVFHRRLEPLVEMAGDCRRPQAQFHGLVRQRALDAQQQFRLRIRQAGANERVGAANIRFRSRR